MKAFLSCKRWLVLIVLLIGIIILLVGCSSGKTVYVPVPQTSTTNFVTQKPTTSQWDWQPSPGNILTGGSYAYFPLNGAYIEAGKTLTLSWSADGSMDAFILTENQFNNFKPANYASDWIAKGNGSSGTISAQIENADRYWAIVRNTFTLGSSIKLYEATMTAR